VSQNPSIFGRKSPFANILNFAPSVPPESARRFHAVQFGKVKIADSPQGLRRGALGEIVGQAVEPCPVFVLQADQFGHGGAPTLRAAASVDRPPVADLGHSVRMGRPKSCLPLRERHRPIPQWLTPCHCLPLFRYITHSSRMSPGCHLARRMTFATV